MTQPTVPIAFELPKLPKRARPYVALVVAGATPVDAGRDLELTEEEQKVFQGHPVIRAHIRAGRIAQIDNTAILLELAYIALLDPIEFFDDTGRLRPIHEMPETARRAIASFDVELDSKGTQIHKVKLWDKIAAIRLLGQSRGLFAEKMQHDVGPSLEQLIDLALKEKGRGE